MRYVRVGLVLALALFAVWLASAQDNRKASKNDSAAGARSKPGGLHFDVDRLIKEYDRNGNGHLERDELPVYLRDNFDLLDTNKDGKLSREELEKGIAYLQPRRKPSDIVFVLIETSDHDADSQAELQRMYDVLRALDKNNTGKIDPSELAAMRQHLLEERVDSIMKELDADKDRRISRDGARGPVRRNFDRIDINKDGYIDRDELLRAASEREKIRKEK